MLYFWKLIFPEQKVDISAYEFNACAYELVQCLCMQMYMWVCIKPIV